MNQIVPKTKVNSASYKPEATPEISISLPPTMSSHLPPSVGSVDVSMTFFNSNPYVDPNMNGTYKFLFFFHFSFFFKKKKSFKNRLIFNFL